MSRQWGATGIADVRPVKIDTARREQINLELQSKGLLSEAPTAFFEALSQAIGHFNAGREMAEFSKPANVRKNLQTALNAALELYGRLDDLDGNSCQLLAEVEYGGIATLQGAHLLKIIHALREASLLANEYPTKGRLREGHRLGLAMDVADAIDTHIGVKPTTTKEGIYESILTIVLEITTDKEVKSVHDLARKALKEKEQETS